MLKVQEQTLSFVFEQVGDAKEERKRRRKTVVVSPSITKLTQPKKRTKIPVDSDYDVQVSELKEAKSMVIVQ